MIHLSGTTPLDEDQINAETSTRLRTTLTRERKIRALGGIQTRNPGERVAVDPYHRPLGQWNRHTLSYSQQY
jgi:hypothetical protein